MLQDHLHQLKWHVPELQLRPYIQERTENLHFPQAHRVYHSLRTTGLRGKKKRQKQIETLIWSLLWEIYGSFSSIQLRKL